jgi:hypothetical protein
MTVSISGRACQAMGIDDVWRNDIPQPIDTRRRGQGFTYLYADDKRDWLIDRAQTWMSLSSGFSDEDVARDRAAVRAFLKAQGQPV